MSSKKSNYTSTGETYTELILEIFKVNGLLLNAGDRLTKDLGASSARWQVMGAIDLAKTPLTVPQIGRRMGLKRQSIQRTVNILVEDDLIELIENPDHQRAKLAQLTVKGKSILDRISRRQIRWANQVSDGLNPKEIKTGVKLMSEIRRRLST